MTISAKMICDSISPDGIRLSTMQLRYPRFIHAEELTHRILETQPECLFYESIPDGFMYDQDLSRNASSSRAIPVERMIEDLIRDPAMPIYWGSNKPGMQAGAELVGADLNAVQQLWINQMMMSIETAKHMVERGLHKQIANRILEPWAHINVVVTATNWRNFFALRSHTDAQPEIKQLSDKMQLELYNSEPSELQVGEWHLPYILGSDWLALKAMVKTNRITRDEPTYKELVEHAKIVSTARCARVSYLTHDGRETTVEEDIGLAGKLIVNTPLHASPAEHQATPDEKIGPNDIEPRPRWMHKWQHGNLEGWRQHRKMLSNEYVAG